METTRSSGGYYLSISVIWILFFQSVYSDSKFLTTSKPCIFRHILDGVCICNSTYCDTLDVPEPKIGEYNLITSSRGGKRFSIQRLKLNEKKSQYFVETVVLTINPHRRYSKVLGFGGAFTDAVTVNLHKMTKSQRNFFYQSYFDRKYGAAYDIVRIPLGGSDFSVGPWSYNEFPEDDYEVSNMNELDPRDVDRVAFIKELEKYTNRTDLLYLFCTWSPPKWMKSNNDWTGVSNLLPMYYKTWAKYQAKGLRLFKKAGVKPWAISTGNEPSNCLHHNFMTLCWDPFNQMRWTVNYLKPTLVKFGLENVKILAVDDQRISIPYYLQAFEVDPLDNRTLNDVDLIGVHWYNDQVFTAEIFDRIDFVYKKPIIYSESVVGAMVGSSTEDHIAGTVIGSWSRAVGYISKIIEIFSHCISGFVDWNLVLDKQGGPNYVHNYVDSPIIFANGTIIKQPTFYGLAHFSKFLQGDCIRIKTTLNFTETSTVESIAFDCTDKSVVILHNLVSLPTRVKIYDERIGFMFLTLDPKSVNTLTYLNKKQP